MLCMVFWSAEAMNTGTELPMAPSSGAQRKQVKPRERLDEEASPTAGRRFTRA